MRIAFSSKALKNRNFLIKNNLAFAILDKYPVSKGHTLIIPKRHLADYFELSPEEIIAINDLLHMRRRQLLQADNSIEGFNIGVNCGKVAGQTLSHCHIHLMPRYAGDTPNPKGGVRGAIPGKTRLDLLNAIRCT